MMKNGYLRRGTKSCQIPGKAFWRSINLTLSHTTSDQLLEKKELHRAALSTIDVPQFAQLFFLGLS